MNKLQLIESFINLIVPIKDGEIITEERVIKISEPDNRLYLAAYNKLEGGELVLMVTFTIDYDTPSFWAQVLVAILTLTRFWQEINLDTLLKDHPEFNELPDNPQPAPISKALKERSKNKTTTKSPKI